MRKAGKSRTVAIVVVFLVVLVVLVPIVAGFLNDPTPAPTGGVNTPGVAIRLIRPFHPMSSKRSRRSPAARPPSATATLIPKQRRRSGAWTAGKGCSAVTSRDLRISKGWIEAWAAEYGDYDSSRVEDLFGKARPTYEDIERVYRWKSARSVGHFLTNDSEHVVSTVRAALRAKDDAAALARVEGLSGVKARTGSALLAIFRPERYTVMDWRARQTLEAFGYLQDLRRASWTNVWPGYMSLCRDIASRTGVSLRDLDRALWGAQGSTDRPRH